MELNSVLKKVLDRISLKKEEIKKLNELAGNIVREINKAGGIARVGGSLAKGTCVKKDIQDIDIFVVFNSEEETKKLAGILKRAGLAGRQVHGSRDYFQINRDGVIIEIVPVVKFKKAEDVGNITDFSLSHVKYIKKKINSKMIGEIKLAKVFCYANDCYGAESYISGFSGYALELLVVYFRGFVNFLKGIKKKNIIDIEKFFKNDREILQELNESKLQSRIILIDPTYKFRNACAGLSNETFEKFLSGANDFLKNPSEKFFEKEKFNINKFKKKATGNKRFFGIRFETDRQKGNIAGTKMKKFFKYLIKEFERKKQKVLGSDFVYSGGKDANGYLIIKEEKEIDARGPEVGMKEAVKNFKRARKKVYEKNGIFWAKENVRLGEIIENSRKIGEEMGVEFSMMG